LTWGPKVRQLEETELKTGKPIKALDSRPEILPGLGPIWVAFQTLSAGRSIGVGMVAMPCPITFQDIDAYARRYGPEDPDDFERFLRLIRALDSCFMAHAVKPGGGK